MPKVILICGKLCCGKTTYAKKVVKEQNAVLLSCDEIMLTLFGQFCDKHDEMVEKTTIYLLNKSIEFFTVGVNAILDVGFWTRAYREEVNDFYKQNGITPEWHYIDVSRKVWKKNVEKRNAAIESGKQNDYYIDENLAKKCWNIFEEPLPNEINVWYKNDWN